MKNFLLDDVQLQTRVHQMKPLAYIRNRNFLDGDVTQLSPFITHGILDTWQLAQQALKNHPFAKVEKFIFQLAWREFFHRIWEARGDGIFSDLKHPQPERQFDDMPAAILEAKTGIQVLDEALAQLYATGYLHNHARMWCASVVCNIAKTDWRSGARWMFYHLLDGDLASNSLSWQWVAGSYRQRPYLANQDNLNKYSRSVQRDTFLDTSYEKLATLPLPSVLHTRQAPNFSNSLPKSDEVALPKPGETVYLHHIYNLDATWHDGEPGRRILLIEPAMHQRFPLSPQRWQFILHWARHIKDLEIYVGSFQALFPVGTDGIDLRYRTYPSHSHWQGTEEPRRWLAPNVTGYFPSFFSFWKKAKKQIAEQWP